MVLALKLTTVPVSAGGWSMTRLLVGSINPILQHVYLTVQWSYMPIERVIKWKQTLRSFGEVICTCRGSI